MNNQNTKTKLNSSLIWDLPTRIFHWLFVLFFIVAWLTSDDNRYLFVHVFAGYVFFGLMVFRLVWGVIGSKYSKFRSFSYDWPSVYAYLKGLLMGDAAKYIGHNPAGSWAIFLMIFLSALVSVSGLSVLGGEEGHGPLANVLSFSAGEIAKELHELTAWILLVTTLLHLTGVIVESVYHRENLILSMVTGNKSVTAEASSRKHSLLGYSLVLIMVVSGLVYFKGYLTETESAPFIPFVGKVLPDNEAWKTECGDCHLAYHPVLLPKRSWVKLMETQNSHFEEALDLEKETIDEITAFLIANSADSQLNEVAYKIDTTTPIESTPIQITKTVYWKDKHHEIDNKYWKSEKVGSPGNCSACHLDATSGAFEDSAMRLPKL